MGEQTERGKAMSEKHTPGPWQISSTDSSEIETAQGEILLVCRLSEDGDGNENPADARLIASAPDLLAALEAAEKLLTDFTQDSNAEGDSFVSTRNQLRAAIAKAKA